jgi:hypothetical protein
MSMHEIRPSRVVLFAATLAVAVAGISYFVYSEMLPNLRSRPLPSAGDALHRVPLWIGDRDDVRIVLRPHYQLVDADRQNDALLAARLFPDAPETRFAVIWLFHYGETGEIVFDRKDSPLTLEDGEGRTVRPLDLVEALRERGVGPDVALSLLPFHAGETRVEVPAGSYRRVLLALPDGVTPATLESVEILGIPLVRREVIRYRLEDYLADPGDRDVLLEGAQ